MIDYESYEQEEILKPRHSVKKPRTKKSKHKHEYVLQKKELGWTSNGALQIEVCSICGKEGDFKIIRGGQND